MCCILLEMLLRDFVLIMTALEDISASLQSVHYETRAGYEQSALQQCTSRIMNDVSSSHAGSSTPLSLDAEQSTPFHSPLRLSITHRERQRAA